ncbi:hypothetical protein [Curtobacterium sp. P97]|uniref:hypothetical protein n=1 Tax=Curtobacterium sp. P97 TaxID=2939562 RepID=UPI0020401A2B|nr:hypothetical protein [Curtobacterium sp. P97]MCM3521286.1 hypothetical protein [Curtobacterium sp. P97]
MTLPLWLQIVTLAVPVAVAVISSILASRAAGRAQHAEAEAARLRALEERTAQKKFELYQPFLTTLNDLLTPNRSAAALAGMEDVITNFQGFVTVWGSDEVIETFYRWRTSANLNPPNLVTMRLMADLLVAVRRDIAWPDTKVPTLYMIGHRIKDIHEHPEMVKAMTLPLDQFLASQDWTPPFTVPTGTAGRSQRSAANPKRLTVHEASSGRDEQ